jgi:PKD repeat protein
MSTPTTTTEATAPPTTDPEAAEAVLSVPAAGSSAGDASSAAPTATTTTDTLVDGCAPPATTLTAVPSTGTVPLPVEFYLTSSTQPCSTITSWTLSHGSGGGGVVEGAGARKQGNVMVRGDEPLPPSNP